MTSLNQKLSTLKGLDIDSGTASLWVVKTRIENKKMKYTCRWVDIDDDEESVTYLAGKLKLIVKNNINSHDEIEEYDFISKPEDSTFLNMASNNTNMSLIQSKVDQPGNEHPANHEKHILNSSGYIIKIQIGQKYLYAYVRTAGAWNTKKVSTAFWSAFTGEKMVGLSDDKLFKIEDHIDFISYEGELFISNKRSFESAMNFKEGMKEKKDELIADFNSLNLFSTTKPINDYIGDDARHLRSVSSIHDKGFYKDQNFMKNLRKLNASERWGLNIDSNGVIIPEQDKIKLLLTLLNDLRLKSQLSGNVYDASSSIKVPDSNSTSASVV
ncbi:Kiwa anti-phage protein KwaB-like domain-containing protein [Vibrio sp. Vf1514]|uniref:Kiwa anti-phage protein KwaB-like domain-containing protein n=1 Tax=Vibrio sp. Vf1514 TaxID=3437381 RepID=UPI003E12003D